MLGGCGSRRPHLILIDDEVLGAHEQPARPVGAARHGHEQVGAVVDRLAPLAHHVVQAQVQLVQRQVLLRLGRRLARRVLRAVGAASSRAGLQGMPGVREGQHHRGHALCAGYCGWHCGRAAA